MYDVKCDECKKAMRQTDSLRESAAGGVCGDCWAGLLYHGFAHNIDGQLYRITADETTGGAVLVPVAGVR